MGIIEVLQNKLGYWEVKNKPSEMELEHYYSKLYFQNSKGAYEINYSSEELKYFENSNEIKSVIVNSILKSESSKRLLDIGCGEGFTMEHFDRKGWNVLGLDYSIDGVKRHNPKIESKVIQGNIYQSIEKLIFEGSKFEVITILNVLEHVIDPIELLIEINKLLVQGGVLIITVPNDFSHLQKNLLEENKITREFWIQYPDHLNYFGRESLIAICEKTGFKFTKCISDFPIDYFLANPDSNYIEDSSKGKNCHKARVWIDNLNCSISIEKTIALYEALANLGSGRQISGFFVKS